MSQQHQTLSMKPANVPTDGFYRVQLDGREFSVCVIKSRSMYITDKSSSEPIPWEKFERFEGVWWEGNVVPFQSMLPNEEGSPDFTGPAQMHIDLTPFCDPDGTRYSLDRPWILGGWRYATDGRICIRIKTNSPDNVEWKRGSCRDWYVRTDDRDEPRVPDVSGIGWKHFLIDDWQPWPDANYVDGNVPCEADGCDVDYDPSACQACEGKGTVTGPAYQQMGQAWIAVKYDKLIRQLSGAEWSFGGVDHENETPVLFRFDGGEGIIMPIQREDV